ncbi:DUF4433 domain-containing protein [Mucilaginibacter sp. 21P]|uniref:type II toxin-antitoxin system toxin DNA ADP-ribosyl transferase DarT n=1 Tax=Mucilaginibacter sp. 21P TaxID=2778902 RepID=UPI001C567C52|nr:DUF4433 domain-containing protein [Mucilaginibacter sp. 21P]QXV66810.1 DUF4433 domain-containing protein [Mucilaginibacter sp. 21P]
MPINAHEKFCYRITHRDNLAHILVHGLVTKNHESADPAFIGIGNPEIIDVRATTPVRLADYGNVGDYVPFYLTPHSIMLYNIITGYYAPRMPKRAREEIVVIRCLIEELATQPKWFFTDGQANDGESNHYSSLRQLDKIDWECIQNSRFAKSDDYDRPRRYQAEFLVKDVVPSEFFESICVCSEKMAAWTQQQVNSAGKMIKVNVIPEYFF